MRLARAGLPPLARTAWLEIDLDALLGNLDALRSAAPNSLVEPVVKADAYGHGAVPVALALQAAGADGFSVATLDEALELRDAGITAPVLVIYPIPPEHTVTAAEAGIAVAIGHGDPSDAVLAAAGSARPEPPLEVHVEIDTGLGRGGVPPEAAVATLARVAEAPGVRLGGAWTHLAAAEDPESVRRQDAAFGAALDEAGDGYAWGIAPGTIHRHLSGSGGMLGGEAGEWDLVRPGIALYGLLPGGLTTAPGVAAAVDALRPVLSLKARPVRVMDLPAGHGVSYGPSFVTQRPTRIATLPLGYDDGWRRALTDRAEALVRGVRVPLVGRVAMDAIMADVTDVPGDPVTADDEFVLIGEQGDERITADDLAATCGTINHEIVTGMSRRLARVYHAAGSVTGVRTLAGWRS
jgi:alanine racemase